MFVEKKLNKSGSTSASIVDKLGGKKRVVKAMGCSSNREEIEMYVKLGARWIEEHLKGLPLFVCSTA